MVVTRAEYDTQSCLNEDGTGCMEVGLERFKRRGVITGARELAKLVKRAHFIGNVV
jgi:hypothetical protein